jgi:FkbM family methyltransferase
MSDQWFGDTSFSQHGEDLCILNFFTLLGISKPSYLDLGAHHPTNISNTALLYSRGSRGVNVEANPNLIQEFLKQRPDDLNLNVGVATSLGSLPFYMIDEHSGRNTFSKQEAENFVTEYPQFKIQKVINVQCFPIKEILKRCPNGEYPDFLSMDVEGFDYEILKQMDLEYSKTSPKIICVEVRQEDSKKFREVLWPMYPLILRFGSNLVCIREDVYQQLESL